MGKNNIFTSNELEKFLSAARNSGTRKDLAINYLDILDNAGELQVLKKYESMSPTGQKKFKTEINKELKGKKSLLFEKYQEE